MLGASPQDARSHQRFAKKFGINFPLLVDPDGGVAASYGAVGEQVIFGNKLYGIKRSTFVIDENGIIEHALYRVKVKGHIDELKSKLGIVA